MNPIALLLKDYSPIPQYAQVAINGAWEQAIRVEFDQIPKPSTWNISINQSIAIEIFYRLNDGRFAYLGLRYSKDNMLTSPEQFTASFLKLLPTLKLVTLSDACDILSESLTNSKQSYTLNNPESVELGVANYWKSLGPQILWHRNNPKPSRETLASIASQTDTLLRNTKNHIAVEFAYDKPQYWLGVQVSQKHGSDFVLDFPELYQLVQLA